MLLPRVITAVFGLPLLLGAIYFGNLPFLFVILGIILVALREFYYLAEETGYPSYKGIGCFFGGLVAVSVFVNGIGLGQVTENQATSALLGLALLVIVLRSLWKGPSDTTLSEWGITLLGVFYVGWSLAHLLLLRDLRPQGMAATFLLFTIVWVADITAYFVGVRWGKRLIAESISPKKTWEGTLAGILAAMGVAILFQLTVLRPFLNPLEAAVLGGVTGLLAFASDLAESMIKRGAGVKDSSQLLPGHGGLLDRFDSFILTAPFFYYYWAFLKH
jgi:phosphatidate cytidylyltransferase